MMKPEIRNARRAGLAAQLVALLVLAGCGPEPVRETIMPLDQTGLVQAPVQTRMLAAIAGRPDGTWFFKLIAPPDRVGEVSDRVVAFLSALEFDQAGEPVLRLPADWTTHRRGADRFLTVVIPVEGGDPVELAVTRLGPGQDLLANINRWRRQLSLAPLSPEQLDGAVQRIPGAAGELVVFDATGNWNQAAAMPLMAGGAAPNAGAGEAADVHAGAGPAAELPARAAQTAIEETPPVPEGWQAEPGNAMVVSACRLERDGGSVRLSISELPSGPNSWDASLRNWIAEAGLGDWSEGQVAAAIQTLEVSGCPAQRVDLVPEGDGGERAVIGVRIDCGERAVYVKLSGAVSLVREQAGQVNSALRALRLRLPATVDGGRRAETGN